jgi:ribonuclease VapC
VIAVDSSALIAILLAEPLGEACMAALADDDRPKISAVTLAESFIVAQGRGVLPRLQTLLGGFPIEIIAVDGATSARVSAIYAKWGKKNHRAELNIIDCFSYDVARQLDCPLLFIGNDFAQTDIARALG